MEVIQQAAFGESVDVTIRVRAAAGPEPGLHLAGAGQSAWLQHMVVQAGREAEFLGVGGAPVFDEGRED